jgi:hypothetical protein
LTLFNKEERPTKELTMLKVALASCLFGLLFWLGMSWLVNGNQADQPTKTPPVAQADSVAKQPPTPVCVTPNPPEPKDSVPAPEPISEPDERRVTTLTEPFVITVSLDEDRAMQQPLQPFRPASVRIPDQAAPPPVRVAPPKHSLGWNQGLRYNLLVKNPAKHPVYSAIIKEIAGKFQVPGGIINGIWKKESSYWIGRDSHRLGSTWVWAPDLIRPRGRCVRRYGYAKCKYHYDALRAICSQKRNGRPICNPNRTKVSYAGAMGPMQHMAGVMLWCKNGPCRWSSHAVDYDGDGVIDPHYLPEAMAMTAAYLVNRYRSEYCSKFGNNVNRRWECAVNLYFGLGQHHYFSGRSGQKGVVHYWRRWCRFGHCSS